MVILMEKHSHISIAEVRAALRYEPETGRLFWMYRPGHPARWNTRFAGKEAFTTERNGYRTGRINWKTMGAHVIAWSIVTGEWPAAQIDHENRDRSDNRWTNLRPASNAQNNINKAKNAGTASRYKGVGFNKRVQKFYARGTVAGRATTLSYHACETSAALAYDRAARAEYGNFAYLNIRGE